MEQKVKMHKLMQEYLDYWEMQRKRALEYNEVLMDMELLRAQMGEDAFAIMFYASVPCVNLALWIDTIHDITPLLKELAKLGWHQKKEKRTLHQSGGWEWQLEHTETKKRVDVQGLVREAEEVTGPGCRRVKVGEEMVKVAKYEIVCDGEQEGGGGSMTGSIISGTLRNEDLVPVFVEQVMILSTHGDDADFVHGINLRMSEADYFDSDDCIDDLEWLFTRLEELAPQGTWFGAHEGNGSDFGFWPLEDDNAS